MSILFPGLFTLGLPQIYAAEIFTLTLKNEIFEEEKK
jgi:hypothetical protein